MNLREELDIVLITYNRKSYLKETFKQIFAENSPIRDFDITIIDNNSNDGTEDLIKEYVENFANLKYIKNHKNIGGCANVVKALAEIPRKEYVWLLADNDYYDWSLWKDVEQAIKEKKDAIVTISCGHNAGEIFHSSSLISGCIYKTSEITETIIENMYNSINNLFPHLAIIANILNNNKSIGIVSKSIVKIGKNPNQRESFTRGFKKSDLDDERKYIFAMAGYLATTKLIKNKSIRASVIDNAGFEHKNITDLLKTIIIQNKLYHNNYKVNLIKIWNVLNLRQKCLFLKLLFEIYLSFKNYKFYELAEENEWIEYFTEVNEQKHINKLVNRYKNKKILLYGAGLTANVLLKNYDLSKFNIIGIADRKFNNDSEEFFGIKTISPENLNQYQFDTIIFTMKLYENIAKSLKSNGINKEMVTIIKKSYLYPMRF